jgi:predicted house-cleaning noncanonical NTP pyrophosphatase (MazG superfamily)
MIKAYYKLVRDNIVQIIRKSGKKVVFYKLKPKNFNHYLKIKLKEEVEEILKSNSKNKTVERIGDILDIIEYISYESNISQREIANSRKYKNKTKGGFKNKSFLVLTKD